MEEAPALPLRSLVGGDSDSEDCPCASEDSVTVAVASALTGDAIATLCAQPEDTVAQLKVCLWEAEGTPVHRQQLCLGDRLLDDEAPLVALPRESVLSLLRLPFEAERTQELHRAVEHREDAESALRLLEATADPNAKDPSDGWSLLHEASAAGRLDVCRVLLAYGAWPKGETSSRATPLLVAAQSGHVEVVKELLRRAADAERPTREDGASPLLVASMGGHWRVAEELCAAGASVNLATDEGTSPLLVASEAGHLPMVKGLVDARADVGRRGPCGITPLLAAAARGRRSVVVELLWAGAELDARMAGGLAPLHAAAQEGWASVAQALLEHEAAVDALANGSTPLFLACQEGHLEVVQALLKCRARVDLAAGDHATPLLTASQRGHEPVVQLLLRSAACANAQMPDGTSPLVAAAFGGALGVCRMLLALGADPGATARNNALLGSGTSTEVALRNGHLEIAELLGWTRPSPGSPPPE